MHAPDIDLMAINPNQVATLLIAAAVGNALLLRLWQVPSVTKPSAPAKWITGLLVAILPVALCLAGWEMYWNRSEDVMLGVMLYLPIQTTFVAYVFFRHNRRCVTPAGWQRLLLGNCLVLLVPLTLTLAVGEIYFRFFYDTTDSIAYTKVSQRWIKRHYQYNKSKFRDNVEYSLTIAPGKRRVSFLGDSFTAGHGIKRVEDRFSNRIRHLHPDWEIHVLAVNGLNTGGELALVESHTSRGYVLDRVVLVYCLNDINDLLDDWNKALEAAAGKVSRRLPFYDDSYFLDTFYYRFTIARLPWIKDYFSYVREAYRGAKWHEQKQRLRALRDLIAERGGQLSVVTFPFMNALGADYKYQFIHDALGGFWREEQVPHLDLLPVFQDYAPAQLTVNAFDAHPNELANQLAAEAINRFLVYQRKTNSPPPGN
ncbi:MAG TPA: SGNH/GDSL hydrolase family protein [Verrucomicrobiae bacterium]|nr:SGNH/GDSL hydrolase family protein [Verrucomicrobiae bacterium]